jgi:flagellar biosynthesis/type III secretory pathway M-ring protein FliF/YscJ
MMHARITTSQYLRALFFLRPDVPLAQEVPVMAQFSFLVTLVLAVLLLVLAVAWIWVPVMLAGVRRNTAEMLAQQQQTNDLLQALLRDTAQRRSAD